jgi:phage tail tube protein FII
MRLLCTAGRWCALTVRKHSAEAGKLNAMGMCAHAKAHVLQASSTDLSCSNSTCVMQDLFNGQKASEMDNFEYVMHGKVYKLDKRTEEGSTRAVVSVSFGGLLMQLVAESSKLSRFDLDSMVYLLIRKAN